ncbi:MAG: RNA polymerase subunit sigma-70 [Bryobacterales bacterium]|nr:RNA polymerase subunit sigma-70 [Bryobacterales bacterium]
MHAGDRRREGGGGGMYTHVVEPKAGITQLIEQLQEGHDVENELLEAAQAGLKRIARHFMAGERVGHTLQPTALVNEAFVRMFRAQAPRWRNGDEFFSAAARVMRQILIDSARRRMAVRREGVRAPLEEGSATDGRRYAWVEIDIALEKLLAGDEMAGKVAQMHLICGLNFREIGEVMEVSDEKARQEWIYAERWLRRELGGSLFES